MVELSYTYDSISKFYEDALHPTPEGNIEDTLRHLQTEEISFRGNDIATIKRSQYSYTKGLAEMKKLDLKESQLNQSKNTTLKEIEI